jgi:hypothetical protein
MTVMMAVLALTGGAAACSSDDNTASSNPTISLFATSTTIPGVQTTAVGSTTVPDAANVQTTTTTLPPTTTAAPTTTTTPPGASLPLRYDGIGDVRFGADADGAVQVISGVLGAPTSDSGWGGAIRLVG